MTTKVMVYRFNGFRNEHIGDMEFNTDQPILESELLDIAVLRFGEERIYIGNTMMNDGKLSINVFTH